MNIYFVANQEFSGIYGNRWSKYIEWCNLGHLKEVVSLDVSLCQSVIKLKDDDFEYVHYDEDFTYTTFRDLTWLLERTKSIKQKQILAVLHEPEIECNNCFNDARFEFKGYDLIEDGSGISALVNCGGFEGVFSAKDLSDCGLIDNYKRAREIQKLLVEKYPEEVHADCDLWAIWKMR